MYYRNGPNITLVYDLPLNFKVLIWRKSGNWNGPYRLLAVKNEIYCVQLFSGLISFKNTSVKPYFRLKNNYNIKLDELGTLIELDKLEAPPPTLKVL